MAFGRGGKEGLGFSGGRFVFYFGALRKAWGTPSWGRAPISNEEAEVLNFRKTLATGVRRLGRLRRADRDYGGKNKKR